MDVRSVPFKPGSLGNGGVVPSLTATTQTSNDVWQVTTSKSSSTSTTSTSSIFKSHQSFGDGSTTQYPDSATTSATAPSLTTLPEFITSSSTTTSQSPSPEATASSPIIPDFASPLPPANLTNHHAFVLPIILSLGIPLLFAAMFFTYRHHYPNHYAKTEKYCPFRRSINFIKNLPPILAFRQRHERNRGIMERQKRYMTRRSRSRLWSRVPSMVGPPRNGQVVRDAEQETDEWLRDNMLEHYGEKERDSLGTAGLSLPATGTEGDHKGVSPSLRGTEYQSSRSAWDKHFKAGSTHRATSRHLVTFQRASTAASRLPMPPMRPLSGIFQPTLSPFQTSETYKPGQLTGDGPDGAQKETEATRRMREMVRMQREKVLREEAMEAALSLGTNCDKGGLEESCGNLVGKGGN